MWQKNRVVRCDVEKFKGSVRKYTLKDVQLLFSENDIYMKILEMDAYIQNRGLERK